MDTKELMLKKNSENSIIDKLTITRKDYAIKTAGSYLYEYIGKHLYYTFEQLLHIEDKESFISVLSEENEGKAFLARLLKTDGSYEWFVLSIEKVMEDRIIIKTTNIASVITANVKIKENNKWLRNLMDLWDYLYFFYNTADDRFYITRMKREGILNLYEGTLADWIDNGLKNGMFPKAQRKVLMGFKENLMLQANLVEVNFSTSYFSQNTEMQSFTAKATMSVIDGVPMMTGIISASDGSHIELDGFVNTSARDALTGLFNKKDIEMLARQHIKYQPNQEMMLAIIDLDDFKYVNDSRGHMFGDEVLLKATEVMKNAVGDKGFVGRIGGDEFMLCVTKANTEDDQRNILRSIKNGIMQMYTEKDDGFVQTCSIGCARTPLNAKDYKLLFKLADYALYLAKEKGKCRYIIYKPEKHGYPDFNDVDNLVTIKPKNTVAMVTFVGSMYRDIATSAKDLHTLLADIRAYLEIDRLVVYGSDCKIIDMAASEKAAEYNDSVVDCNYINYPEIKNMIVDEGILRFNNSLAVEATNKEAYDMIVAQKLEALLQVKVDSFDGKDCWYVNFECIDKHTWSDADKDNYRLLANILCGIFQK